jgi:hypothetical protein
MNRQSDEPVSEKMTRHEPTNHAVQNRIRTSQPRYLLVGWILLLLLGALFLFGSLSDLLADGRSGLPSDHLDAFSTIAGVTWNNAKLSLPKIIHYITSLEIAYAVHELVFGLLFLIIVAIPVRWSWWPCCVPMLANLTYTLTMSHYSTTILGYSLIADVALPVLLLLHIPVFFGKSRPTG